MTSKYQKDMKRILEFLEKKGPVSLDMIDNHIGDLTYRQVQYCLRILKEKGKVKSRPVLGYMSRVRWVRT